MINEGIGCGVIFDKRSCTRGLKIKPSSVRRRYWRFNESPPIRLIGSSSRRVCTCVDGR